MSEKQVFTNSDLQAILDEITFQNSVMNFHWKFEFRPITVNYEGDAEFFDPNINQMVKATDPIRKGWLLWATFERPDTNTGAMGRGRGRDEIVWEGLTESAVVKTAWVIVDLLVKHELMEGYRYENKRPFNPHHTMEELTSLEKG